MSLMLRWFWGNSIWCFVTLLFTTILRGTGEGVEDKGEGGARGDGEGGAQGDGDGDGPNSLSRRDSLTGKEEWVSESREEDDPTSFWEADMAPL